ncbi:MAG: histidine phosphatase family protein [Pseudomonadota bacterium]
MIYLVRHGEAAASWGQHPDPGLSVPGRQQAEDVADKLEAMGISRALTSPMARCQETAEAFAAQSGLNLVIEPTVIEIPTPPGLSDRVTWLRKLMAGTWSETPELVQNWHAALLRTIHDLSDNTVVFTHFIAINAVVGALENKPEVMVFRPNYCSVTALEKVKDGLRLVTRGESLETKVL